MRILHVSDCYLPRLGGIEKQVHELAARQQRAGHEVHVITSVAGTPQDSDAAHVGRPRRMGAADRIRYETTLAGRAAVLAHECDVMHVHASTWSPLAFLTAGARARRGTPTVLTLHSLWAYAEPLFATANVLRRWGSWPVTWSAVSSVAAQPLERIIEPGRPVAVLPNGVDPPAWRIERRPHDPERIVVISVGRLAERKRPRQLLQMLLLARAAIPDRIRLEAVLVGDGPLRERLQRAVERHGMADWVRLTGAADHAQIRSLFQDADFYVAPAHLESFGIAALEARCAGLPVVAHAHSGVADYVTDGVEGLLARDDAHMTERIVELATEPATLERLRQHNLLTPSAISWDTVLEQCTALYQQAADPPAPRTLGRLRVPSVP